jgi:hypothetical protein
VLGTRTLLPHRHSPPDDDIVVPMWHVYIVRCADDAFFIGEPRDVARRVAKYIVLPLVAAYLTERAVGRSSSRASVVARLGWLPVSLLGAVVFLIAASQVHVVAESLHDLGRGNSASCASTVSATRALSIPATRSAPQASKAITMTGVSAPRLPAGSHGWPWAAVGIGTPAMARPAPRR